MAIVQLCRCHEPWTAACPPRSRQGCVQSGSKPNRVCPSRYGVHNTTSSFHGLRPVHSAQLEPGEARLRGQVFVSLKSKSSFNMHFFYSSVQPT